MQSSYYKITCLVIARAPAGPQGHSGRGDGAKRYWVMPGAARPTFVIFLTKVGQKKRNTGLSGVAGYGAEGVSNKLHKVYHPSPGIARGKAQERMKNFFEKCGILHKFHRERPERAERGDQKYFLTPSGARDSSSLMVMVNLMLCCSPKLFSQSRNFSVSLSHWPPTILVRLSIKMWVMS